MKLPARQKENGTYPGANEWMRGWNDALDAVAELNEPPPSDGPTRVSQWGGDPFPWVVRVPSGQLWGPFASNEGAVAWADKALPFEQSLDFEDVMPPSPTETPARVHAPETDPNTGHGHVRPRPDGVKARCGGPHMCKVCAIEAAQQPQPGGTT